MRLYYSPTSPYARKVRVVLLEKKLEGEVQSVIVNPLDPETPIPNPLGKIPLLELDDGTTLFDSTVICGYLDTIGSGPELAADEGKRHWLIQRAQALGNGVMDAAFNLVMEGRKPETERSAFWQERWRGAIANALTEISADVRMDPESYHIGRITYACALGYIDFRLPDIDWRASNLALAEWYRAMMTRESLSATQPGL